MDIIVADSDYVIALMNSNDIHSNKVFTLLNELSNENVKIIYPVTVLSESVSTMQRKVGNRKLALDILDLVTKEDFIVETVDSKIFNEAIKFFKLNTSKQNTIFDAIVAAIASKYNAKAIFSFDKWYKKLGFKLVGDLY